MLKRLVLMAVLMLLISSCGSSNPTARPLENNPPTQPSSMQDTPIKPVATPTASLTTAPASEFLPHGAFLAFTDDSNQPSKITLFDPIQSSRLVISKPAGDILHWDAAGLSPDGQYLAYYTGHLDTLTDLSAVPAISQHIELIIMRTVDGSIVFQKSLLNKDYPQNFLQAADAIKAYPPSNFDLLKDSRDDLAASLLAAFTAFIYTNTWSPDGRVLAFASGSDGTSSDVYTYDIDKNAVTRITDGLSEVYKMVWSPDGNWILNSGVYWVGEGMCGMWFVSAANGSGSSGFSTKGSVDKSVLRGCDFDQWVSDHQAIVSEDENGRGIFNLEVLDINQKTIDLIWPHTFHSFAFDPVAQQATISTAGEPQQNATYFQQGTYRVDLATHRTVSIAPDMQYLTYLGWESGETIAGIPLDSSDICFLPSGSCSGFANFGQKQFSGLSVSTSRKNLVLYSDTGLWHIFPDLISQSATRDYTEKVGSVIWSPNPGSDPANDLGLVESNSTSSPYYLYNPVTSLMSPLPDFSGSNLQGWYWRK